MGGSAQEPVNLEDTEEHDALPAPNRQVPPLQATLLKAVRLHPHRGQQAACKKPGVDGKPPQKIV